MEKIEQPNLEAPKSVITLSKDNSAGPMGKNVKLWILGLMIAFISIMIIALISVLVIFFVTGSTSTINLDDMISGNGQPCNDNKSCFGNLQVFSLAILNYLYYKFEEKIVVLIYWKFN